MSLPTVNDASAPLSKQSAGVGGKGGDVGGAFLLAQVRWKINGNRFGPNWPKIPTYK